MYRVREGALVLGQTGVFVISKSLFSTSWPRLGTLTCPSDVHSQLKLSVEQIEQLQNRLRGQEEEVLVVVKSPNMTIKRCEIIALQIIWLAKLLGHTFILL